MNILHFALRKIAGRGRPRGSFPRPMSPPASWRRTIVPMTAALLGLAVLPPQMEAQQQFQGWCAPVKLEILQEMTLERIGFEATLTVTNNQGQDAITDFFAELTFEDPALSEEGAPNDASDFFFVRAPTMEGINAVDGTGVIGPSKTAVIRWFIIPKPTAGGSDPFGKPFRIGARLSGKLGGVEIPKDQMFVFPDTITVRPEPQLEITYFLPRDVQADNPFTPEIESPVPFTLGVLVKNSGHGIARDVMIDSEQPRIVENVQDLLLVAQLMGARVMDSPLDRASLTVNLGDIQPGETKKGAWDMITSLSGEFTEFRATYTHASELGGEETSLIKSLDSHFIVAEVMNDQPGRDDLLDFLAVTDRNEELIPDALYESEGNVLFVNHQQDVEVVSPLDTNGDFEIRLQSHFEGWGYMRLHDPGEAKLDIVRVTRSDGKVLHPRNVWTNIRYERGTNRKLTYLNILDLTAANAVYDYHLEYAQPALDSEVPATEIHFAGESSLVEGKYFVARDTQMYFTAEDDSPVSMFYSLNEGPFVPALPFTLDAPGEYTVDFYAEDVSGNVEEVQRVVLVLPGDVPASVDIAMNQGSLFHAGDTLSVRSNESEFVISVESSPLEATVEVAIFAGVTSFPTLSGMPPSPTPFDTATLTVGGDHVDFYRYRLGEGSWSDERSIAEPIALTGLSGSVTVAVKGRSQFGTYPADEEALETTWTVDPAAAPFVATGVPPTPTRRSDAQIELAGDGISLYRWTIDDGYYRAEAPLSQPIALTAFEAGEQEISLIGFQNDSWQEQEEASKINWTVDPVYGSDFSDLNMVYSEWLGDVQGRNIPFSWDGRDFGETMLPAGIYTVRVTVMDGLGRSSVATKLIRIENLAEDVSSLAAAERAAGKPHAKGDWAVWQDRASGTWNIVGRRLKDEEAAITPITTGTLNQENPYTDGHYVVWQGRSESGAWNVWMRDLETLDPTVRITDSTANHNTRPVIDWPWIVYETRPVEDAQATVQLHYKNVLTGETGQVDPTTQNQQYADIHAGRVVWHDLRDVGSGEIYYANLETGETKRLTENEHGQFNPRIFGHWIVWQDNRFSQVDLFGYDLLRNREVRLTTTSHNETRPFLQGNWVVYEEDSVGPNLANLRLLHLENLRGVPVTNTVSAKRRPTLAAGFAIWEEDGPAGTEIRTAELPALQALYANNNTVPVSPELASRYGDAFALLADWQERADVAAVTRYPSLSFGTAAEAATWDEGAASGDNFALNAGDFLWVQFSERGIADHGTRASNSLELANGSTVVSYTGFPPGYHAQAIVDALGADNVRAVRMLDAGEGLWRAIEIRDGEILGANFAVPEVSVLFVEMDNPVADWQPGATQ